MNGIPISAEGPGRPAAGARTPNPRVALWLLSAAFIAFLTTLGVGLIATGHRF